MFKSRTPSRVGPVQQSRILYRDDRTAIGEYRWFSYRAGEKRRSPIGNLHLIVIPWTAVRITQDGTEPVIADSSTIVFYNHFQMYEAEQLLDDRPERSIYIVPDEDALRECVREIDPSGAENSSRLLRFTHGPCRANDFLNVRALVSRLMRERDQLDGLGVQEALLEIMHESVRAAYGARRAIDWRSQKASERTNRRHAEAVIATRELLVRAFDQPMGLKDIADATGVSSYHLCRVFRRLVGMSIHQYRNELRLRASMEYLCDSREDLAQIALRMGFSSQAHFTTAFATRFARTPAAFRHEAQRGTLARAQI